MIEGNRRIQVIALASAMVIVVAWYFLLWGPETKSLKSAHKAQTAAVQQIGQLSSQVGSLQTVVRQIPADNAKFAQLETALPDNPQLDQALNLLNQVAVQTGVILASLGPSTPAAAASGGPQAAASQAAGSSAITLSMSVQGNLNQVKAFLSALQSLPRTVVVDKISLSGGTSSTATISARIFYAGQATP